MPAGSGEMLNPSSIVIPTYAGTAAASGVAKMEVGSLFLSGGKLYFVDSAASHEIITSS